jgi:hypothetical protein
VWQDQLRPLLSQMIFRVNLALGQNLVNHIELRLDSGCLPEFLPHPKFSREPLQIDHIAPELLVAAAEISDAGLRRTFLGAAMSCLKRLESQKN